MFIQQQNLGRRFGEINLHVSPSVALAADSSAAVVGDLLFNVDLIVCGGFVLRACFVMQRERERLFFLLHFCLFDNM